MSRIALLSEELINQIAAGEVVERPASVVKELCENALDAGARDIRIFVRAAGFDLIRIVDDGEGMSPEDARLAVQRHATSKLRQLDDLNTLTTKGFRGEALPSIAAVSYFSLTTATATASVGTRVRIEGGAAPQFEEAPPVPGTDIVVEELFFNTPARRKFLRREQTELGHIQDAVLRLALPHPHVSFTLEHEGKVLLSLPANASDARDRVSVALGKELAGHLLVVEENRLGLQIRGYIVSPEHSLSNARGLYTFVNRRYVRDRTLNYAVQRAFQESLPPGRQPLAVVFIDMDPAAVDVNVHPQKIEVRFADGRSVADAIVAAVQRPLRHLHQQALSTEITQSSSPFYANAVDRYLTQAAEAHWGGPLPLPMPRAQEPLSGFGQRQPDLNGAPPQDFFSTLKVLGVLSKQFWVCESDSGSLVVLNAHAAWERMFLQRFLEQVARKNGSSQSSLFSRAVTVTPEETVLIQDGLDAFKQLGIELEMFGPETFAVKAIPEALQETDVRVLLQELCRVIPAPGDDSEHRWLPACRTLACHAASGATSREASHEELRRLFKALDEADFDAGPPVHAELILQQTPLLELSGKAQRQRPLS
jgi:DNA mismatch repair protein MutL